ncbi:hypothetical protein ACVJGD_005488 [Bradyrhizobium sp. USDA 10063]
MRAFAFAILLATGSTAFADEIVTTSRTDGLGRTVTTSTSTAGTYTMTTGRNYDGSYTTRSQSAPNRPCSYQERAMGRC